MELTKEQKERVIDILYKSFKENGSTNFVVKQDKKKEGRIRTLIEYSYAKGEEQGRIYLSADGNACAIVLFPEKEKTSVKGIYWTLKLLFGSIGLSRVGKISSREKLIKKNHPKHDFVHLWYIGVNPEHQGKGLGTELMSKIIADSQEQQKPIFLETSNEKNFPFYERLGFDRIAELDDLGYPLKMYLKQTTT